MHFKANVPLVLLALTTASIASTPVLDEISINPTRAIFEAGPVVARDPLNPNNDNTCGPFNGHTCDPNKPGGGWCCSSFGYCGNGKLYCGKGCQDKFGRCDAGKANKRPPKVKHCGAKHKKKCEKGYCCSANGLCGDTPSFCGDHCQQVFGHCDAPKDKPKISPKPHEPLKSDPKEAKEERCGSGFHGRKCSNNQCCSRAGYCGLGVEFCTVPQNCQRNFGRCDSDDVPAGLSTADDPRYLVGKVSYDLAINQCKVPKTIAMTFDDGPSPNTQQLLDILAKAGVKATFFIGANNNGKGEIDKVDKWIEAIKRMEADGHQIASHTWSHPHMNSLTSAERKEEMYKSERALANIIGKYPSYMRAPYIECNVESGCMADMKTLGYHVVGWGVDSTDWAHENDLDKMIEAVDAGFKNAPDDGHMLLIQHDTLPKSALQLTKHVLEKVKEKGWRAVTLSECLGESPDFAYRYPSRVEASSMAKQACFISDGKSCGQLDPFETKEQCFNSNKKCRQQMSEQYSSKKASAAFHRFRDLCDQQFLFCAQCDKSKAPECKMSEFAFSSKE